MDSPRCHIIGTVWFHHHTWNLFRFRLIGSNIKASFTLQTTPHFGLFWLFSTKSQWYNLVQIWFYIILDLARVLLVFWIFLMYGIEADEPRSKVIMAILTIFGHFWTNFGALIVSLKMWAKNKSWSMGLPQVSCNWHWLIWLSNLQFITI